MWVKKSKKFLTAAGAFASPCLVAPKTLSSESVLVSSFGGAWLSLVPRGVVNARATSRASSVNLGAGNRATDLLCKCATAIPVDLPTSVGSACLSGRGLQISCNSRRRILWKEVEPRIRRLGQLSQKIAKCLVLFAPKFRMCR